MNSSNDEIIRFASLDGVETGITVFPGPKPAAPVIVFFPAMGVRSSFYKPLALAFNQCGYNAVTADLRGHGLSSVRAKPGVIYGYREMVEYDWPAISDQVKNRFPGSDLVLLGHSLGGQLSALHLAANSKQVRALIMVAAPSLYSGTKDFPENVRYLFRIHYFRLMAEFYGYFPGKKFGVGADESKGVLRSWSRVNATGSYRLKGSKLNHEALMKDVTAPVLSISFIDDTYAPKKSVDMFCEKLSSASLTRWDLSAADLGAVMLGHFGWAKQADPLAEKISPWLDSALDKS